MSGQHKHPTISFRVSDYERREIEAKIKASGMMKKDYFARSCIYNRVCVVGKKETIYPLVEELKKMREAMVQLGQEFGIGGDVSLSEEELEDMQTDYLNLLKAIIWMLDGARYLWMGEEDEPSGKDNSDGGKGGGAGG